MVRRRFSFTTTSQKHARCCVNDLFVIFKFFVYFGLHANFQRMVSLMGATFQNRMVATLVTHLLCYKFAGNKVTRVS